MGFIERIDANIDKEISDLFGGSGWENYPKAKKFHDKAFYDMIKMDIALLVTVGALAIHPGGIVLGAEVVRQGVKAYIDCYRMTRTHREEKASEKNLKT